MEVTLTLTDVQHSRLKSHLFPNDGNEASAIILCGRCAGDRRHRLVAREVHPISYRQCSTRTPTQVTWSTDVIVSLLERAESQGWTVAKIHSHPNGAARFSTTDDKSDRELMPAIRGWFDDDFFHSSLVMLPTGEMFGRYIDIDDNLVPLAHINVVGDDLLFWYAEPFDDTIPEFVASHTQALGEGTYERIRRLSIGVIGCSGTGSPVIEQLARLGVGELVLIDGDFVEDRNINRILNATMNDVQDGRHKVDVLSDAISRIGIGTHVFQLNTDLWKPQAVRAVAQCDLIFGCVDTVDGRFLLSTLASHYMLPYIDLGVRIHAVPDGEHKGNIQAICGSVHYLKPGGSSLISRGVFTLEEVAAAGLARNDPVAHARQVKDGYVTGVPIARPAVISLNMNIASLGVHELLARLHPFRDNPNSAYDHIQIDLADMTVHFDSYPDPCPVFNMDVGKGDAKPLLGMLEFSEDITE
ncbi:MAG: ThiF family adenylyltransferase [Gemmatimonadota bacterium]|nr:ThiF family adenylyltransferase [Gemmatimonadota bacterium]